MMAENQIVLLPRIDYYKWVRSVQRYALHFGVGITQDPAKVAGFSIVTVVIGRNSYPHEGDIVEWLKVRYSGVNIDPIVVESAEALSKLLDTRIEKGQQYGKLVGEKTGPDPLPRYPKNRLYLFWPTDYPTLLQPFGANPEIYSQYGLPGHEGVDIRAPLGANVYVCAAGEVAFVSEDPAAPKYGKHIQIMHAGGYRTIYAHLERILVSKGDRVKPRQLIARADSTRNASSHHLHLTLTKDQATARGETDYPGDIIDPTPFLVYPHQQPDVLEAMGMNGGEPVQRYPWARPCLVGLASRWGGSMQEVDYSVIDKARIEAVRIHAKTTSNTLIRMQELFPEIFFLARMTIEDGSKPLSPRKWLEGMRLDIERLYKHGVRYFEIQQSPNLLQFGWRTTWSSGEQFAAWWLAVAEKLWVEFSGIKLGFPGVSPGGQVPGLRMDSTVFLDGADPAMVKADWIGVNGYWVNEVERVSKDKGRFYQKMRERFPEKLLFIMEFGNLNRHTHPTQKGLEYVRFFQELRDTPGVGAAFAQVVSSARGYESLAWRSEAGELSQIVEFVGARQF
jgi:murein DD-endopeptidase MepM/ murein hydrolase activator NlpD